MSILKLIFRSLLLMAILWAVNAVVIKWPVHVAEIPGRKVWTNDLPPSGAEAATKNGFPNQSNASVAAEIHDSSGKVRNVPVD